MGWTKDQILNLLGNNIREITYVNVGRPDDVTLEYGPGVVNTGVFDTAHPDKEISSQPIIKLSRGQYLTYRNAFVDVKTKRPIDVRWTLVNHNGPKDMVMIAKQKQMTFQVLYFTTSEWRVDFFDHETQQPVAINALIAPLAWTMPIHPPRIKTKTIISMLWAIPFTWEVKNCSTASIKVGFLILILR